MISKEVATIRDILMEMACLSEAESTQIAWVIYNKIDAEWSSLEAR